ncbi:hypothetical protein MUCCIDRAFT_105276 [Mucor lusitanicus CBS 277.49]|uniref:Uncharacterized protein n=1 Tax=Mucor lusitanicus CBS 277.49 TaxID=747725 RepID=A0A162ZWX3_MUCCL|nr:hypothetical protein MUCCIDRAFT_105276 [Mucor lusitanicus CBS 277.49]
MLSFKKSYTENAAMIDDKTLSRKGKLSSIFLTKQPKPTSKAKKDTSNKQIENNDAGMIIQPIHIKQDDWKLSLLTELNLLHHDEHRDMNIDQQQMCIVNSCQPMERKQDLVKQKLDIAAARRNEIKEIRLREQMDTALFETMRLLRQQEFEKENSNYLSRRPSLPMCQL